MIPHAVGRRLTAGLVLGAGWLLTAVGVLAGEGVALPRSTLISNADLQFRLVQGEWRNQPATLVVHQPAEGDSFPVAVISPSPARVVFERLPIPDGARDRASLGIGTLERLYVLALRQEPEAWFCLAEVGQSCEAASKADSHAELLRKLVEAHERAHPAVRWHSVAMVPASIKGSSADRVAVRVTRDQRPLEGASVYFNRAPHSGCVAKSTANGLATCELVDQHGEEESHPGQDNAAVVATFSGDVRKDLVLVPSTVVFVATRPEPTAKATQ